PTLDYVVTKVPRFPFDKFNDANRTLSTQMKATGEVMAIGRTVEESLLKAVRSLEIGACHLELEKLKGMSKHDLVDLIIANTDERIFAIAEAFRNDIPLDYIYSLTKIDRFFLEKVLHIVELERKLKSDGMTKDSLYLAKRFGFADEYLASLWDVSGLTVREKRKELKILPVYKMIDTCASEFKSYVPYFYSTYERENESIVTDNKKVIVLGSGPIRIGQGVEFDYSTVHAVWALKEEGYEAIIINNNPETVSTDYTLSDKLYFEPLTFEDVMNVIELEKLKGMSKHDIVDLIIANTDERIFAIAEAFRNDIPLDYIYSLTKIDRFFLEKVLHIVELERKLKSDGMTKDSLYLAKRFGFSDEYLASLWGVSGLTVREKRKEFKILPVYKMIDTCASEFKSYVPYFYSTYERENESIVTDNKKVIVLGSGPIRIGQGVEFDYSTVHAVWALKEEGYEAIIINNNPETVSTDYTLSDKLYFEPLTFEDVMNVIELEKPSGVIVALGGQTAINLADDLTAAGVKIIGSDSEAIANAEDRDKFIAALNKLNIPMPDGRAVFNVEDGVKAAKDIGYPVLVRPSYVLGGRMMHIVYDEKSLKGFLSEAVKLNKKHPVLIDKYIVGTECEVDAVCDGNEVFIPGIMEHIEKAGVHSGDSMSVYPAMSLGEKVESVIVDYTSRVGVALKIVGPFNIQFIVDRKDNDKVYIIEVNPRSSRSVPFLAKSTSVPIANVSTKVMLGKSLKEQGYTGVFAKKDRWYVKAPVFSFSKLSGLDAVLSPEMKSTGEAIGYDKSLNRAILKAIKASGMKVANYGTVFATIADKDKDVALKLLKRFYDLGFNIEATSGTAEFLKKHGIRTRVKKKISQGSEEILESLRKGYVTYVVNTISDGEMTGAKDGVKIRRTAIENNVPVFTSLDTVNVLLDVLEETTMGISCI
ncbi:MAG: carbamoyl-phosphate synthase large subunit, partial [Acidaminococcus sp.]|nr:carbamoyl-phosphate synthase large subunit [Acidaminococcus sp.]